MAEDNPVDVANEPRNVVRLPASSPGRAKQQPARILAFPATAQGRRHAGVKITSKGLASGKMTRGQKIVRIVNVLLSDETTDDQLDGLLQAAEQIVE